jgi:hypothetical protein
MTTITATPKSVRPHLMVAEVEADSGYRYWSAPMFRLEMDLWLYKELRFGSGLSDLCCANGCWCWEDEGK